MPNELVIVAYAGPDGSDEQCATAHIDGQKLIRAYVSLFYCHAVFK